MSLFMLMDGHGKAYEPTLITPHKGCMSNDIPAHIDNEWKNCRFGSTDTGYMNQKFFKKSILKFLG